MLIDTHAHLYAEQFDKDRAEMVQRALDHNIKKIFMPNIDSASIEGMLALEKKYPNNCYPMMGLHPCHVKENYKEELAIVKHWLDKRPFCAVGEIGIDLYWDKTFFEQQKDAFRTQINWAKELQIPIIIHAREALDEIIEIVQEEKDERLQGIFHCFTGNAAQAQAIIDLEFYLGLGGVLTFKKSGLDKIIESISLKHLVLETDAPYLSPTPKRGRRNESSYIRFVAKKLATIKNLSEKEVIEQSTKNALDVFKM